MTASAAGRLYGRNVLYRSPEVKAIVIHLPPALRRQSITMEFRPVVLLSRRERSATSFTDMSGTVWLTRQEYTTFKPENTLLRERYWITLSSMTTGQARLQLECLAPLQLDIYGNHEIIVAHRKFIEDDPDKKKSA